MGRRPSAKATAGKLPTYEGVVDEEEYETRIIVYAQGIDYHDEDFLGKGKNKKEQAKILKAQQAEALHFKPVLDYLKTRLARPGQVFKIEENSEENRGNISKILNENKLDKLKSTRRVGLYTNEKKKVKYVIVQIVSKKDFKMALETEELHVIYGGHSRGGKGACFGTYDVMADQKGNQWEEGVKGGEEDSGLFRMGYLYNLVPIGDMLHHEYDFTPVRAEDDLPKPETDHPFSLHPDVRKKLKLLTKIRLDNVRRTKKLPSGKLEVFFEDFERAHVLSKSESGEYYGRIIKKKIKKKEREVLTHVLHVAGWKPDEPALTGPRDPCRYAPNLSETDMKCRVFCHFGCSSRAHYWDIVRRNEYKGWERPKPPTDKYAYFTSFIPPPCHVTVAFWLYHLLSYPKEQKYKSWWFSLEYAKREASKDIHKLKRQGAFYPPKMIY